MLVLFGIIQAVLGGAQLGAVLAHLTIFQWASLAQAGISAPRDVARLVAFSKEMDRRFPCNKKCQRDIERRLHAIKGGPIGWGQSPLQFN